MLEVWDIHVDAVTVFVACGTQWRTAALSDWRTVRLLRTGLDYSAVLAAMRQMGIRDKRGRIFAQLRELEAYALQAFAEVS